MKLFHLTPTGRYVLGHPRIRLQEFHTATVEASVFTKMARLQRSHKKELYRYQSRKLRKMLSFAQRHIPFYSHNSSKKGLMGDPFEEFSKLRIITEETLLSNPLSFINPAADLRKAWRNRTSGSAGRRQGTLADPLCFAARGEARP